MKMSIKSLWREPLFHFLLIGAGLFLLFSIMNDPVSNNEKRIVVTPGQVEQLAAQFKRTWMRPPTEDELAGLVENYVRDEVFYREALAMGLDQNDPLVRRRMRMKLEFILEDLSSEEVTDEVLTAFLQQHADEFRVEPQVSFRQVYLDPDKRRDMEADAKSMLASLKQGAAPESVGDPTLIPKEYRLATQSEIAQSFGERFAEEVVALEPGDWTGPVYSPFGGHVLKVTERVDAHLPELAEIRNQVEREFLAQRRQELKDAIYRKFLDRYEVVMEQPKKQGYDSGEAVAATPAEEGTR